MMRRSDKYLPVSWDEAFAAIGAELKALDPKSVVLYTSGRASLEASYMYQLFGRMYGTNNLPDSLQHVPRDRPLSRLPQVIGVPVGTVLIAGFRAYRLHFLLRSQRDDQRAAHAAPACSSAREARRSDHHVQSAARARPRALHQSADPGRRCSTGGTTQISTQYHQVRVGGDIAAIVGMCKARDRG